MNIDDLRKQIPDETSCRKLFEKLIWPDGRLCPHCQFSNLHDAPGKDCARLKVMCGPPLYRPTC